MGYGAELNSGVIEEAWRSTGLSAFIVAALVVSLTLGFCMVLPPSERPAVPSGGNDFQVYAVGNVSPIQSPKSIPTPQTVGSTPTQIVEIVLIVILAALVTILIAMWLTRKPTAQPAPRFCPTCGRSNARTSAYCNMCGKALPPV